MTTSQALNLTKGLPDFDLIKNLTVFDMTVFCVLFSYGNSFTSLLKEPSFDVSLGNL